MSADMPPGSLNLESQLLSIMDVLVKAAVAEISQLFSESCASLRLHLSQSLKENESLRMRMKVMRSEVFSLRLQTRHSRPCSRFSPGRGNVPKPRANKSQVVIKPSAVQKPVREAVPISLQTDGNSSSSVARTQCADVESPDVILIKDEDDVGGCEPAGGPDDFGSLSPQDGVDTAAPGLKPSCLTGSADELRIVSIHGRGEGPLQEDADILFSASELQALTSLSPDHKVAHDGLINFSPCAGDRLPARAMPEGGAGLARSAQQLERSQLASAALSAAMQADAAHPGGAGQFGQQQQQQQGVFLHAAGKSLDCSFCGESFVAREDLIVHRATHTGETPVTCSFCGKSFVNKTTLTIHMRIHTGEKPYACVQCGKRFTQNGSLKIHLRTHSGEKPYSCSQCTASFNNPSNLRRHMITHNTNGAL